MKLNIRSVILALSITAFGTLPTQATGFTDTFSGPSVDPAWKTDRKEPATFQTDSGQLEIGVSATDFDSVNGFYNTQGRQRDAAINGNWTVTGQLDVTSDLINSPNSRRTELWTRTGAVGDEANESKSDYPIFGLENNDGTVGAAWHIWDDTAGVWINLSNPVNLGINTLSIMGDATSYKYYLNGNLVYTDLTGKTFNNLTTVFVEAKTYGQDDYSAHWDNISATRSAPDLGNTAGLLAAGFGGLVTFTKLRKKSQTA